MTLLTTTQQAVTYDSKTHKLVPIVPTEEMIQAACLSQQNGDTYYDTYAEWWDSHSSGISERIRCYLVNEYKSFITAAPSAPSGWISAEDALPKAQKPVLIRYLNHRGKLATTMGWYCPAKTVESGCFDGEVNDEYDDVSDTYYMKEQWVDESAEGEYQYPITGVTHWMPIPAPKEPA